MKKILLVLAGLTVVSSGWCESLNLEKGMVVCRNKAALEAMKELGGYDQLPEFLIGTACFKLASDLSGQIASEDQNTLEIAPRLRRRIGQPVNLWLEKPTAQEFPG